MRCTKGEHELHPAVENRVVIEPSSVDALGWIEDSADFAPNAIVSRGDFMQLVNGVLTLYRAV